MIRPRRVTDLAACISLFEVVHACDGYPIYLPTDLGAFVTTADELGAWVAAHEDRITGHVALHRRTWDGAMDVALAVLGCRDDDVAVVARLVVAPSVRRSGTGRSLLVKATEAARALGRIPVLDVAAHYESALALYDAAGWSRIGTVEFPLPDGTTAAEFVYAWTEQ